MRSGKLIERVTFRSPAEPVSDGQGGMVDGWNDEFTYRAGFQRLRGSETVQAARLSGRQPTVITVRSSADSRRVDTDWSIVDTRTGETFNIRSREITPDRQYVQFLAESGVAV